MAEPEVAICWLCFRSLGERVEWHHPTPKSRGGRDKVAIHPICHRTLHARFSNGELQRLGANVAALRGDLEIARFLVWIEDKDPDFHAPTHRRK
jgi:hypothetical protein